MGDQVKIAFSGIIRSVQPRSNVWRYRLDNRSHNVTGFNLFLTGTIDDESEPHMVHAAALYTIWENRARYRTRATA